MFDLYMKPYYPLRVKSYFSGRVGWVDGWMVGDLGIKANLNSSCIVEVEV